MPWPSVKLREVHKCLNQGTLPIHTEGCPDSGENEVLYMETGNHHGKYGIWGGKFDRVFCSFFACSPTHRPSRL